VHGPNITGAVGSRGAADPMIHHLSPWTLLITAPEAVEGRFLGLVSHVMTVGRCGRPSRCRGMNRLRSGTPRIVLK
jgi:hypothetical protein